METRFERVGITSVLRRYYVGAFGGVAMTVPAPRRATEADIAACAAVVNGWIDGTDWMDRDVAPEEIERMIREAFPAREMWVIGEPVAGYMSVDPAEAKVGALYCEVTGQGYGKALLDAAKAGREALWLSTHVPNTAAHRFYEREGFAKTGDLPQEEGPDEIRMAWRREGAS